MIDPSTTNRFLRPKASPFGSTTPSIGSIRHFAAAEGVGRVDADVPSHGEARLADFF